MSDLDFQIVPHGGPDYDDSVDLRDRVLRQPLGLKFTPEQLAAENDSLHLIGRLDAGVCACCILVDHGDGRFQVRQVAIDPQFQRQGIGRRLMQFAEETAASRGGRQLFCHARMAVKDFYLTLRYESVGEPFTEVGIAHIEMEKQLMECRGN